MALGGVAKSCAINSLYLVYAHVVIKVPDLIVVVHYSMASFVLHIIFNSPVWYEFNFSDTPYLHHKIFRHLSFFHQSPPKKFCERSRNK